MVTLLRRLNRWRRRCRFCRGEGGRPLPPPMAMIQAAIKVAPQHAMKIINSPPLWITCPFCDGTGERR